MSKTADKAREGMMMLFAALAFLVGLGLKLYHTGALVAAALA